MSNGYSIKYLFLQIKRVLYRLPAIFAGTLLLTVTLALVLLTIVDNANSGEKQSMVEVGVTGDVSNDYVDMAIAALQSLDDSRMAVNLYIMEEEEEARGQLLEGKIGAYFVIPEGIVESIMYGESFKVKYYTCKGQAGLGTILVNEFCEVLYRLLTKSQNGIYGMQDLCSEYGNEEAFWTGTRDLNIEYITFLLERQRVFEIQEIGISKELSLIGYYICSFLIVFFMLFGLNGCALFINKDIALNKLLAAQGCSSFAQVISEFMSYSLLLIVSSFAVLGAFGMACDANHVRTAEWNFVDLFTMWHFGVRLIPIMCMFTAMALLGHELAGNLVSGLLLQFLMTVGMGYLSGCFYPDSFFPEVIQLLGRMLPSGVALEYASKCMLGKMCWQESLLVMFYAFCFLTLACLFRKKKLSMDGMC